MGDFFSWYFDLWPHAWHNFSELLALVVLTPVAVGAALLLLIAVFGGLVQLIGALTRSVRRPN